MASLRLLAPRASLTFHSKQLQQRLLLPSVRHASTAPPKPRVLEKPERFNPPSHPSRLRSRQRQYPGPPISEHERQAQKVRRYPHMMPPEGSFMFWFLTNRKLHLSITLSVLLGLVFAIWYNDFIHTTPYTSLLPPNSLFFSHPFQYLSRYAEVYQMHVAYTSEQTYDHRKRKVEDVRKRAEYRRAHGMDPADQQTLGGWTAKSDEEVRGPGMREGGVGSVAGLEGVQASRELVQGGLEGAETGEDGTYVDFEGKRQSVRKKWFGIW